MIADKTVGRMREAVLLQKGRLKALVSFLRYQTYVESDESLFILSRIKIVFAEFWNKLLSSEQWW